MIAFTDIRNDEGGFDNVAFEYDEQAEIMQEIKDRIGRLDKNGDIDELYGELDQLIFEFQDKTDAIEAAASCIAEIKFSNLNIAFDELRRDLKKCKLKAKKIADEVIKTIRRIA